MRTERSPGPCDILVKPNKVGLQNLAQLLKFIEHIKRRNNNDTMKLAIILTNKLALFFGNIENSEKNPSTSYFGKHLSFVHILKRPAPRQQLIRY